MTLPVSGVSGAMVVLKSRKDVATLWPKRRVNASWALFLVVVGVLFLPG